MCTFKSTKTVILMALLSLLLVNCNANIDKNQDQEMGATTLLKSGEVESLPASSDPVDSSPGSVPGNAGDSTEMEEKASFDISSWLTYTDELYYFSVIYPEYYEIKPFLNEEVDSQALAAVHFFDSRGDLADIAPPAFSVRIYPNPEDQTLKAWFNANNYGNDKEWITEPYDGENFSGVKVLSTNYMSPGEFIFILHKEWIFQLTPVGHEANKMLESFSFIQ